MILANLQAPQFFQGKWAAGNPVITGITKFFTFDSATDPYGLLYLGLGSGDVKIKVAGWYLIRGVCTIESSTANGNCIFVVANTSKSLASVSYWTCSSAGSSGVVQAELLCYCDVNDILQMYCSNSVATARIVQAAVGAVSTFTVLKVA